MPPPARHKQGFLFTESSEEVTWTTDETGKRIVKTYLLKQCTLPRSGIPINWKRYTELGQKLEIYMRRCDFVFPDNCNIPVEMIEGKKLYKVKVWRLCMRGLREVLVEALKEASQSPTSPGIEERISDGLLKATDPDAAPYRDGNQWCDVQYAKKIGVSSQHIDRARKNGCREVRLTDRRKADTPGKHYVYRRAELNELSDSIPKEFQVQME